MKKLFLCSILLITGLSLEAQNLFLVEKEAKPVVYNKMIFGQFIEHFHRQVYGGIFQPGSPLSDKDGFRTDVVDALRELKIPIVRWPGGCFVSSYPDKAIDLAPDFAALTGKMSKQVQAILLSEASADDFNDIGAENRVVPTEKTLKVTNGKNLNTATHTGFIEN